MDSVFLTIAYWIVMVLGGLLGWLICMIFPRTAFCFIAAAVIRTAYPEFNSGIFWIMAIMAGFWHFVLDFSALAGYVND